MDDQMTVKTLKLYPSKIVCGYTVFVASCADFDSSFISVLILIYV